MQTSTRTQAAASHTPRRMRWWQPAPQVYLNGARLGGRAVLPLYVELVTDVVIGLFDDVVTNST